jgi:hypothetical protein
MEAKPEAKVLPFRRPNLIIFERFDVDDMAAFFRCKDGDSIFRFTLRSTGELEDICITTQDEKIVLPEAFTDKQKEKADRLVSEAGSIHTEQLATWHGLGSSERLSMLLEWGKDTLNQLSTAIQAAAADDPVLYSDEIQDMCQDIDLHEAYMAGLETAISLL